MKKMDIVFLSYEEPSAESNFAALSKRFPRTKRLHGVQGLARAHKISAQMVDTKYFFIVDGDNEILPSFDLDAINQPNDMGLVNIWPSINPVNGLVYGNGGIKLCPREKILNHHTDQIDFIVSGDYRVYFQDRPASITRINTSPFSGWRAAFRECVKLRAPVSNSGLSSTSMNWRQEKIRIWSTVGADALHGAWVISGAKDGVRYAEENTNDKAALAKINDQLWLKNEFRRRYIEPPTI